MAIVPHKDALFYARYRLSFDSLLWNYTHALLRQDGVSEEYLHQDNSADERNADTQQRADQEVFCELFTMELRIARN